LENKKKNELNEKKEKGTFYSELRTIKEIKKTQDNLKKVVLF
jgi:hypothetical protein